MPRTQASSTLRKELEEKIRNGQCVYCRRPAGPSSPLTREHVIPRARGGGRKDVRIIVPACARCNHRRGCQELVLFLLARPRRISAFLDYLYGLSPVSIQQIDPRVFAELYAAVWLLSECSDAGREWRAQLRRLCAGRTLHRRRYAARRIVGAVGGRMESLRERGSHRGGPSCPLPAGADDAPRMQMEEPLELLTSRLLGLLSLVWQVSAEDVQREMRRQMERDPAHPEKPLADTGDDGSILPLDGWKRRRRRRRLRVDQRRGRAARGRAA